MTIFASLSTIQGNDVSLHPSKVLGELSDLDISGLVILVMVINMFIQHPQVLINVSEATLHVFSNLLERSVQVDMLWLRAKLHIIWLQTWWDSGNVVGQAMD